MKTEAQLNQTIEKPTVQSQLLMERIVKARDEISKRFERPMMRKNIGKCYKYRNSYGGDGRNWWLYRRIFDVVGGQCWTMAIQADCDRRIMIEEHRWGTNIPRGDIEISEAEYRCGVEKILNRLNQRVGRTEKS